MQKKKKNQKSKDLFKRIYDMRPEFRLYQESKKERETHRLYEMEPNKSKLELQKWSKVTIGIIHSSLLLTQIRIKHSLPDQTL